MNYPPPPGFPAPSAPAPQAPQGYAPAPAPAPQAPPGYPPQAPQYPPQGYPAPQAPQGYSPAVAGLPTTQALGTGDGARHPFFEFRETLSPSGSPVPVAATYVCRVQRFVRNGGQNDADPSFVIEAEILQSDNPALPPGTVGAWVRKQNGSKWAATYLTKDLQRIIAALLGYRDATHAAEIGALNAPLDQGAALSTPSHYLYQLVQMLDSERGPGAAKDRLIKIVASPGKTPYATKEDGTVRRQSQISFYPVDG